MIPYIGLLRNFCNAFRILTFNEFIINFIVNLIKFA